ncbi:hypothetical protein ACD661_06720 [Legionella lytica]|uniref:Chromosome partition protein Smc n=1 Tax=Legionella lytica TaxID=96232 RepID=A0ABW8D6B8_9GAMM
MAHSLNDLITSLATILVRYHDSQGINVCIKETEPTAVKKAARDYAMKLLQLDESDQEFARLNVECTTKYADFKRIDLLTFIKDEIKILRELSLRTTPFLESDDESTHSEFDDYKNKITMLLIDFKGLLITQKENIYEARIKRLNEPTPIKLGLHGMIDSKRMGNIFGMLKSSPLCNSGDLVKVELLDRFNLTELSTTSEIRIVAEHICESHQHALMAAQHKAIIEGMKKQYGEEYSALSSELQDLEVKLKTKEEKLLELQNTLNELQKTREAEAQERKILEAKLSKTEEGLKETEAQLNKTEEALKEAEAKIAEQNLTMEKMQQELKTLKEEKTRRAPTGVLSPFLTGQYPYPQLMYGLNNLNRTMGRPQSNSTSEDPETSATFDL